MPKLIWEYVANSLDAAKDGAPVIIVVEITSNYAMISDNGRGMSREELGNFFQMHGENVQRKLGKRVRGRFGTGKCAAFGLANYLRIDAYQAGLRNVVELHRQDIEQAQSGTAFPVRDVVVNEPTDEQDGTIVEIREFNIKRPNIDRVIAYVERHLSRYRQRARITVNGHECKFKEPPSVRQFERFPPPEVAQHIGKMRLLVKVSPVPLSDDARGIDILSYGVWHGTTLAGIEKREYADYLFGQIDVPILEDGEWPIPAFDNTRNNTLNPQNPVVAVLLGWLSEELEKIRVKTLEMERERRNSETTRRLVKEARKISRLLNDDFGQQELELELARRISRRSKGQKLHEILEEQAKLERTTSDGPWPWEQARLAPDADDGFKAGKSRELGSGMGGEAALWEPVKFTVTGDEIEPWEYVEFESAVDGETTLSEQTEHASGLAMQETLVGGDIPSNPSPVPPENPEPQPEENEEQPKKKRPVFSIDFESLTHDSPRSRYDSDTKTIYINLDHPQIAGALEAGGGLTDSRQFLAMCYEAIMVEYALALPYEKLEKGELTDVSDALFDVKETINRVSRRFMRALGS